VKNKGGFYTNQIVFSIQSVNSRERHNVRSRSTKQALAVKTAAGSKAKPNFTRITNAVEKIESNNSIELERRLEILNSYIKQIMAYQNKIEKIDYTDVKRFEIEEECVAAKTALLSNFSDFRFSFDIR